MVYTGPSKGCAHCRRRKVKCDETRPFCRKCIRLKLDCYGYPLSVNVKVNAAALEERTVTAGFLAQHDESLYQELGLPQAVSPDIELTSLSFLHRNYLLSSRGRLTSAGLFEVLLAFDVLASPNSALGRAASTLAVATLCVWTGHQFMNRHSERQLGFALSALRAELADPLQSRTDETLMAVIALSTYDAISARERLVKKEGRHDNGALAMVKHRKSCNFISPVSQRLLFWSRRGTLEKAISMRVAVDQDPDIWTDPPGMILTPAMRLDRIALSVVGLLANFESKRCSFPDDVGEMCRLYSAAVDLHELSHWPSHIPPVSYPTRLTRARQSHDHSDSHTWYRDYCDVYLSVQDAAVWNCYRSRRLDILNVLLYLGPILSAEPEALIYDVVPAQEDVALHAAEFQSFIDEICASVPFHIGSRSRPAHVEEFTMLDQTVFPTRSDAASASWALPQVPATEQKRNAVAFGAWYIIAPLLHVTKLLRGPDGGLLRQRVRPGQTEWIGGQLRRVMTLQRMSSGGEAS